MNIDGLNAMDGVHPKAVNCLHGLACYLVCEGGCGLLRKNVALEEGDEAIPCLWCGKRARPYMVLTGEPDKAKYASDKLVPSTTACVVVIGSSLRKDLKAMIECLQNLST